MCNAERNHAVDNVRFFLIFTVVFGHLLTVSAPFPGNEFVYKIIFSFHMPAFIFLFGYYAKYDLGRILSRWIIPYIVFQAIYLFFVQTVLQSTVSWQFTTPYWALWYLLACAFFQLMLPIYDLPGKENRKGRAYMLLIAFVLALLAGYDESVGTYLTLSRFLVFQFWFILGHYCGQHTLFDRLNFPRKKQILILLGALVLVGISIGLMHWDAIMPDSLYGMYFYRRVNGSPLLRAVTYFTALSWILFLFVALKPILSRKIPCITRIGQNTLPIYLLHGFFVKPIDAYFPETLNSFLQVFPLAILIVLLTGNRICKNLVNFVSLTWLEKYMAKLL